MKTENIEEAIWLLRQRAIREQDPSITEVTSAADDELAALSPPTPEDVARWYKEVDAILSKHVQGCKAECPCTALVRLRDWAARVPRLEAEVANLKDCERGADAVAAEALAAQRTAESERDAARQEAETLRTAYADTLTKATAAEQEAGRLRMACSTLETEAARLRERVATLEGAVAVAEGEAMRENGIAARALARGDAAERRVAELEKQVAQREADMRALAADVKAWSGKCADLQARPTPAPAGLLEAVGKAANAARAGLLNALDVGFTETRSHAIAGHINAIEATVRAAYDAAKGGPTPAPGEPTVTHAALAAALSNLVTMVEEDDALNDPAKEPDRYAALYNAKELLRRVTGGHALKVLLESRVVDRLAALKNPLHLAETMAADPKALTAIYGLSATQQDWNDFLDWLPLYLGLSLDTPPSGPGGGETYETPVHHAEECEANEDDTQGDPLPCSMDCDAAPRSVLVPMSTPEGPALAPVPGFAMPPPGVQDAIRAQPEPAAPEVVWQGDGVRVLADGTVERDRATVGVALNTLARALAEAKRENARLKDEVRRQIAVQRTIADASKEALAKAAESMRERAAQSVERSRGGWVSDPLPDAKTVKEVLADGIRALPLE